MDNKNYVKYTNRFNKLYIMEIVLNIISVLLIGLIIFLPIFQATTSGNSVTSFSYIDENILNINAFSLDGDYSKFSLCLMILNMITIFLGVINIIVSVIYLINFLIKLISKKEKTYKKEYIRLKNSIKLSTRKKIKNNYYKNTRIAWYYVTVLIDVVCYFYIKEVFSSYNLPEKLKEITFIFSFNGVSGYFVLIILFFIVHIVILVLKNIMQQEIVYDIEDDIDAFGGEPSN